MITLLAFGIGLLIRASAGGIAITLGLLLVVPTILSAIAELTHQTWVADIGQFLPSRAGGQLYAYQAGNQPAGAGGAITLNAWQGFSVLAAEVIAVGIAAMTSSSAATADHPAPKQPIHQQAHSSHCPP